MSSSEQVREQIARELKTHRRVRAVNCGRHYACLCGEVLRSNSHHALAEHQSDVLLARWPVLAGVTDEMVEAGARAVDPAAWEESQWQAGGRENVLPESEGARAARDEARGLARAVLVAARDARTT